MNPEKLETVRKLLAKASAAGATEAEQELYTAKASELMIKHGIEDAMLADADRSNTEKIVDRSVLATGTFAPELMRMVNMMTKALRLQPYYVKMRNSSTIHVHIVGFESDVARAELLATSLMLQSASAMRQWWSAFKQQYSHVSFTATDSYKQRRSFLIGFGQTVAQRLEVQVTQVVDETVKENPGTDLVLVNREEEVSKWTEENVPGLRVTRGRGRVYSHNGMNGGVAAGAQANLGGTGVSNISGAKAVSN